jgi:hypothetical protein
MAWTLGIDTPKDNEGNNLVQLGKTIRVRITAFNNRFKIYFDDNLIYDISDYDDPFLDGYFGMYTKASEVCYSNLEYKQL